ncbi:MAG: type 4a pilus biogenesis protein PilO [Candidatus Omnitrophica bacterium]|nr:type 4a pilus biogenesis protein PilO [Candidatus Omnitrophota bacterium]
MDLNNIKNSFQDKEKLRKYGWTAGTGVLILLVYYFLFLGPQSAALKKYQSQAGTLKQQVADASRLVSNLEVIREQKINLSERINLIEGKIPGEREVTVLLDYVSDMAGESKVEIIGLEPVRAGKIKRPPSLAQGQQLQINPFSETLVLVRGKGGYHQLGRFINKIENSGIMRLKEFRVNGPAKDKERCSFRCLVGMVVRRKAAR